MRLRAVIYCLILVFTLIVSFTGMAFADVLQIVSGLEVGYRIDDFSWNIAGNIFGQDPNILSELSWKDLKIFQVKAHTRIDLDQNVFIQGSVNYGIIMSGKNQDSDYSGDNRTGEFSRSNNGANGDNVMDVSIALGYNATSNPSRFKLSPLVGYSFNWQNLRMTDGYQTVNIDPDTGETDYTGPFPGLNSTYKTEWQGPWFGVNLEGEISSQWTVFGNFEYHLADYTGKGNWNLRDDLDHPVSFLHSADGDGYTCSVGTAFSPNDQLQISLKYYFSSWSTGSGTDQTFGANGTSGITQFNEANWHSEAIMLAIVREF